MTERPIVLTGASGFIAKHIAQQLLSAGHQVRATLRSPAKADAVRAAVLPGLTADAAARLSFVTLDLMRDDGWTQALAGAGALLHTASPFPPSQPRDPQEVIRPAVDGTLRALRAARDAGVDRVVLTSSIVAITDRRDKLFDESDWLDPALPGTTPYAQSKVLAERAAWDFVAAEGQGMRLSTINPGFVLGPILDRDFGTSIGVVRRILAGRDPAMPKLGYPVVDVRDVALAHLRALQRPEAAGQRFIAANGTLWFPQMARILKAAHPDRRIPTRQAPKLLLRLLALFDPQIRMILPDIGHSVQVSNARARQVLGIDFIAPDEALRQSAAGLLARGLV